MRNERRRLLKALTVGGGATTVAKVPVQWNTPIIESVVLPAHAQTTNAVLSGSEDALVSADEGMFLRQFARRGLVDALIPEAQAGQPRPFLPDVSTVFAFAERDLDKGSGWWRVQVLFHYQFNFDDLTELSPHLPSIGLVRDAHAVIAEPCTVEELFTKRLQVGEDGDSDWANNVPQTDGCGELPTIFEDNLNIRLVNFTDPNNPLSGSVKIKSEELWDLPISLTPGGSPLSVDCGDMACEDPLDD